MKSRSRDHDRSAHPHQENRQRIAAEAARMITELGIRDYHHAKLRAAERLGIADQRSLPQNAAIEAALRDYQRLFGGASHTQHLAELRRCAVEAMRFFAAFEPRLVGAVLDGTADAHSAICLHLFSDDIDAPVRFLQDQRIPFDLLSRRLRWSVNEAEDATALRFDADQFTIDLTLLPLDALRMAPLDRVNAKPMRRATVTAVQALLDPSLTPD